MGGTYRIFNGGGRTEQFFVLEDFSGSMKKFLNSEKFSWDSQGIFGGEEFFGRAEQFMRALKNLRGGLENFFGGAE